MSGRWNDEGWLSWSVVSRLAGGVVSVPVVAGFLVLGVVVVAGRSLRDVAAWAWRPARPAAADAVAADPAPDVTAVPEPVLEARDSQAA